MTKQIIIRHIPDCPNATLARQRVEAAISHIQGPVPTVVVEEVADLDEAARRDFHGSPTLLFDGIDPFAPPTGGPAFACRTYATDSGREGAPSIHQIIKALGSGEKR